MLRGNSVTPLELAVLGKHPSYIDGADPVEVKPIDKIPSLFDGADSLELAVLDNFSTYWDRRTEVFKRASWLIWVDLGELAAIDTLCDGGDLFELAAVRKHPLGGTGPWQLTEEDGSSGKLTS